MPGSGSGGDHEVDAPLLARALIALNRHDELLRELGGLFDAAGRDLYLVGGSVRDAVLGRLSPDLDFTTDARPDEVQDIVRSWADALWDTGIEFGTVGVSRGGRRVEITTFRADTYDRVSRNPQVRFGNRLTAFLRGHWRQTFAFRTAAEWRSTLADLGFDVEIAPMSKGTPFANVLLVARRR